MSNLLKSNWVILKQDTKRVIDYNPVIADKLDILQQALLKQKSFAEEDGFVAGLNVNQVEVVCQDQKEVQEEDIEVIYENLLREANGKAKEIVDKAQNEADNIKEQAFSQGQDAGYREGKDAADKEYALKLKELSEKENQLQQEYDKKIQELEPILLNTVADVYQYIFGLEIEKRKDVLLHVIHNTILKLESSHVFTVRVSNEDYKYVNDNANIISQNVSETKTIEIIEDSSLSVTQCIIETDGGLYDCSIDVELDELTKAIKALAYSQ